MDVKKIVSQSKLRKQKSSLLCCLDVKYPLHVIAAHLM